MKAQTTKEAFTEMINTRGIYKILDIPSSTVKSYRRYVQEGKISIDKMEELLAKAGWHVITEKKWEAPRFGYPLSRVPEDERILR